MIIEYNRKISVEDTLPRLSIFWDDLSSLQKKNYLVYIKANVVGSFNLFINKIKLEESQALAKVISLNVKKASIVLDDDIDVKLVEDLLLLSNDVSKIVLYQVLQNDGKLGDIK